MSSLGASTDYTAFDLRELTAAAVARRFMRLSVLFGLIGIGMGIYMGISEDFALRPVHVHVNLLGWVSCALFALVYRAVPRMADDSLTGWHLAFAAGGMVAMVFAFPLHLYGFEWTDPIVSVAFLANAIGMVLFTVLVFKHF